jgi:hypothetical protein
VNGLAELRDEDLVLALGIADPAGDDCRIATLVEDRAVSLEPAVDVGELPAKPGLAVFRVGVGLGCSGEDLTSLVDPIVVEQRCQPLRILRAGRRP